MKCPSCGKITDDTTYCYHCKTELVLHQKVHMMAMRLYNKGLELAQGRYLSGAKESLSMCIHLQKQHIDARNLLGLIYWELGETGQAIKQWVISASYKKEENIANEYLARIQKSPYELEQLSNTISLYNKALEYILQGSDDIALINLRKAISQNPNYIEAKCLRALYYIKENNDSEARELIKEIFLIDKDHPKAIRYLNFLDQGSSPRRKDISQNATTKQMKGTSIESIPRIGTTSNMIKPKSLADSIVPFILGIICALAVYAILITPAETTKLQEQIRQVQSTENEIKSQMQVAIDQKEQMIQQLQAENAKLLEEQGKVQEEQLKQQQLNQFQSAQQLSTNRQWVEAADALYAIKTEYLSEDIKTQYTTLTGEVYIKAGEQLYRDGYNQYQRKNYAEAQQILEKSFLYAKDQYFSDNSLYIIGRCYEAQGNMERAKEYYQSVVEQYKDTDSAPYAKRRLQ